MKKVGVTIGAVILMIIGLAAGILLIGKEQEFREKAAINDSYGSAFLSLATASETIKVGETFTALVDINNGSAKANYAEIHLLYDETHLEALSITKGTFWTSALAQDSKINNTNGMLSYRLTGTEDIHLGTGSLALITFRAKKIGNTTISFSSETALVHTSQTNTNLLTGTTPLILTIR